jgi:flagellar hook-associated protein 1 FlgK
MGRRALFTQQRALDVTGHNIANANTEGYTRQIADMSASLPYTVPAFNSPVTPLQVGTGVDITALRRVREGFLDAQIRKETSTFGYWESKRDALKKIEVILREPSDNGLRTVMDQFWSSMQELSKNPESEGVRALVRETGITLANTFNQLSKQFTDLQTDADTSIGIKVSEANNYASQINALNKQISVLQAAGQNANDLRDKRDLLVDKLAKIMNITYSEDAAGIMTITVGGVNYVDAATATTGIINTINKTGAGATLNWTLPPAGPVTVTGGEIYGLNEVYATITTNYLIDLNSLASTFASEVNTLHSAGFGLGAVPPTGNNFFAGGPPITAANLQVAAPILADLKNIAAASTAAGSPGDGSNALKMAQLKQKLTMSAGTVTFDDFYRSLASRLGVQSQEAIRMSDNQDFLLAQLKNNRNEISGVSLDEEMTNMVRFQQSYNAAARLVTAMDEMIDVVVNRMGLVGR